MNAVMVKAQLALVAAQAQLTLEKLNNRKHWDRELYHECSKIANEARKLVELTETR